MDSTNSYTRDMDYYSNSYIRVIGCSKLFTPGFIDPNSGSIHGMRHAEFFSLLYF